MRAPGGVGDGSSAPFGGTSRAGQLRLGRPAETGWRWLSPTGWVAFPAPTSAADTARRGSLGCRGRGDGDRGGFAHGADRGRPSTAANAAAAGGGATTLVVAVLDPGGALVVARIGDSTAFVVDEDGRSWRELFEAPTEDDSVTTTTAALPAEDAVPELAEATLRDGQTLVLTTDGVADPWRDGPATVAPFLASALAGRPGPVELAQLADFSRQGCHDDRTLVSAACGPGERRSRARAKVI